MGREKTDAEPGSPEPKTKKYRTRSGNAKTKPWNTPAKNIQEFEEIIEDHTDAEKTKVCSLKVRTHSDRIPMWIDANKAYFNGSLESNTGYKCTWKNKDMQLAVTDPSKPGDNGKVLTIHFYHTGTILLHGKGSKWYAESIFPKVKEAVNKLVRESLRQDGGPDNDQAVPGATGTIDDNCETIDTSSNSVTAAMTATDDNDSQEHDADPTQTTTPEPVVEDLTVEKENKSEYTTPKSVSSPTIRKVLGGLENIILSPFSKGKSREERQRADRSRRALINENSPKEQPPNTEGNAEQIYTALVDDLNELKTLVFRNKETIDKQGETINNLQCNLQNRKKEIAKQAQHIEDLKTELQRQRDITNGLTETLASQRADHEALQAQVVLLTNQAQAVATSTKPKCSDSQGDKSRFDRLYSEIVTNSVTKSPAGPATQVPTGPATQAPTGPATKSPVGPATQAPAGPAGDIAASTRTENTRATTQVRVFADSLWNDVDPTKLYKHKNTNIVKSTTLPRAIERINTSPDTTTELVIIHVGSNDMDNTKSRPDSVDICVEQTRELIDAAKSSYPNAKIAISQVLPRGMNMESGLNRNIASYNTTIERSCQEDNKLTYIRHRLLSEDRTLYKPDGIHIRPDTGVRLMVADVKRTLRHQDEATARRRRWNTDGQDTKPVRRTPMRGSELYSQLDQCPPFPWNNPSPRPPPAPRPPPQWTSWNRQTGPMRAETQDKRHVVEKLVNMLTDFLKH
ncbi:hypothetical protein Bbelb_270200 [Branchiostoma belcheri]|nr:hypothetical protein Bbelb_270200 [Branchiostoma belcheri]